MLLFVVLFQAKHTLTVYDVRKMYEVDSAYFHTFLVAKTTHNCVHVLSCSHERACTLGIGMQTALNSYHNLSS